MVSHQILVVSTLNKVSRSIPTSASNYFIFSYYTPFVPLFLDRF
jgi:hypothetical protein